MNKSIVVIVVSVLVAAGVLALSLFLLRSKEEEFIPLEKTHIHAAFHVYVDNTLQDYSSVKYMSIMPCSEEEQEVTVESEQHEKAHLHDYVGDVVHVHRRTAKWSDLFHNIDVSFAGELEGYVNGQPVSNIMQTEIIADSQVLILLGENDNIDEKLANLPGIEHIREVEAQSESCGD